MDWSPLYYDSRQFKAEPQNIASAGCPDFLYNGQVNHNPALPDRGDGKAAELGTQQIIAPSIAAGGFTLNDETELKKLEADERLSMMPFKDHFSTLSTTTDNIVSSISKDTLAVHESDPGYLSTCASARLGCLRISYYKSGATHVSVMGKAGGSGVMEPQPMSKTWGCDSSMFIRMYPQEMTKEEMILEMRKEKDIKTWVLRLVGLLVAWLALYCCFNPIALAADVMGDCLGYIPFFGPAVESLLEGVVEMFLCIISCGFGCSCGLFIIAIVWLGMRPLVGGPLLAGVILLFIVGLCACHNAERDPRKIRVKAKQKPYQKPA